MSFDEWRDRLHSFVKRVGRIGVSLCLYKCLSQHSKTPRQIGQEGVGAALGEAPIDVDGLLQRYQRFLAPAQVGEFDAEVIQAPRQIGQEGVGAGCGEVSIDVEGLLRRRQRLLAPAQLGEADAECGYTYGEIAEYRFMSFRHSLRCQLESFCARKIGATLSNA